MSKIEWGKITKAAAKSAGRWFRQQVFYRGKNSTPLIFYPYGFHANAKADNESLVLMFGVNGDASNRVGLPWQPFTRPDLEEGEVAFYQPGTNTIIRFEKEGKSIQITTDILVKVNAPEAEFSGNVKVEGNLTVVGSTTLSATVTSNGKDISDTGTKLPGGYNIAGTPVTGNSGGTP